MQVYCASVIWLTVGLTGIAALQHDKKVGEFYIQMTGKCCIITIVGE